ncbi:ImmA/IrrE family metallo-endopeptidase [Paenibacillus segetis]|uniref:IrrE N-terminal-like domain-containing protein n=1 Tax=Paenibacillus segetis TaxID=1325360 RepID=A0ABQ1Y9I6_9BACL|nr:ImmA/IrrE family metallo-endopeptidase [Paenibacillus segetis]GGH16972.1 hypothetical protein GCM10008013_12100 [Paenibacillus segetis]
MFIHYQMTNLEQFLEDIYKQNNITSPHQISIDEISHRLNVWVHKAEVRSRAVESTAGMHSMFLDSRITPEEQHFEFLHELCHLLRHTGNQTIMPESFTQAQEDEAERFILYAAVPFSMFSQLPIPGYHSEAVAYLSEIFRVPFEFAERRLDQIIRREFQGILMDAVNQADMTEERKPQWTAETHRILDKLDRQLVANGMPSYEDKGLLRP